MARQLIKTKYCDRCPTNHQRPAVVTRRFGFDDRQWKIDLCEQHDDMLTRDFYSWGLLGETVETSKGTFGDQESMRRLAELRTKQTAEDRAFTTAPCLKLPIDHEEWIFTQHALERMEERGVDVVEVLWTCVAPTMRRPGHDPGNMVHERGETKVVCNPKDKAIITVALLTNDERKAVGL